MNIEALSETAVNWPALSSAEKRELVKSYADDDLSAGSIAKIIGVSRNAIIGVVHRSKGSVKLNGGTFTHRPAPPRTSERPKRKRPPRPRRVRLSAATVAPSEDMSATINAESVWTPLPGTTPVDLLSRDGCAFPVQVDGKTLFCNCAKAAGTAYCAPHHRLMRRPK